MHRNKTTHARGGEDTPHSPPISHTHPQAGMHGPPMHPAAGAYYNPVRVVLVRSMAAISRTLSGPMLLSLRLWRWWERGRGNGEWDGNEKERMK